MKPLRPLLSVPALTFLLGAAVLFSGCVSQKYQAASAPNAQPPRLDADLGGSAEVKARLDAIIIYQGLGSWKKSAYWDEFLVTFTPESDQPVTLTAASLVDYAGRSVPAGTDPWQLEKASQSQRDRYTRDGVNFALNTLGYVAFTYGAVGLGALTGVAVNGTLDGLVVGAYAGLVALPVTAVVIYANNRKQQHHIETEFNRRRLALPLALTPGAPQVGSLFFPMTVGPQALRLEWTKGGDSGATLLPLPLLAGMHRTKPAPPDRSTP